MRRLGQCRGQISISLNQIWVILLANLMEFSSDPDGKILTSPLNENPTCFQGLPFIWRLCSLLLPRGLMQDFPGFDLPPEHAHLPGIGHLDAIQRASTRGSHITDVTWLEIKTQWDLVKISILSWKEKKSYKNRFLFKSCEESVS